jgi:DNA gyrase/topoisomerase IV subunit B
MSESSEDITESAIRSSRKFQEQLILRELSESSQNFTESSIDSSRHLAFVDFSRELIEHLKNIADSSVIFFVELSERKNSSIQSLSEKTRDEISDVILQKLKNRHSEAFRDHRESSHSIISFSSSEADMTEQQQQNRSNQNIQNMIQTVIREMMSEIIQQSVATAMNVTAATARSDPSSSSAELSQMTSRATSESRAKR